MSAVSGELTPVETPDQLYEQLVEKIKEYHPTDNFSMLEKAYNLAREAHKEQKRKSGEPYIIHPLKVAYILAELELDMESIVAGILHDTIEDTPYTYDDIKELLLTELQNSENSLIQQKRKYRQKTTERCFLPWQRI